MQHCKLGTLVLALTLAGCGKTEDKQTVHPPAVNGPTKKSDADGGTKKADKGETAKVEGWGTVKGQVVFAGDVPVRKALDVNKDQGACLAKGDLLDEKMVVDKDTKGVRWAVVWLTDPNGPIPVHPSLKEVKEKKLVLDQPTCMFEPHVLALRQGQILTAKNTAAVPHNINVVGGVQGPNENKIIPPGGSLDIDGFKPSPIAVTISCTIHGWMKGYVRVFNHPYFAVTNEKGEFAIEKAPAGQYNLVVWQEEKGWVTDRAGKPITIKADGTVEEKIELKP